MPRKSQTAVALITALLAVSPVPARAAATDFAKPLSFDVELAPVDGSGVTGIAHMVLRGDRLTMLIRAFGLEPHQVVSVTMRGPEGERSAQCPPGAEEPEAAAEVSEAAKILHPPPLADIRGAVISQQTYTVDVDRLMPLEGRVVILRSAEDEDGEPLACGRVVPYS